MRLHGWFSDTVLQIQYGGRRHTVFTALHGIQMRYSDENTATRKLSVRLSVRPSVKRVNFDKTKKKDLSRFLYHTKDPSSLRKNGL